MLLPFMERWSAARPEPRRLMKRSALRRSEPADRMAQGRGQNGMSHRPQRLLGVARCRKHGEEASGPFRLPADLNPENRDCPGDIGRATGGSEPTAGGRSRQPQRPACRELHRIGTGGIGDQHPAPSTVSRMTGRWERLRDSALEAGDAGRRPPEKSRRRWAQETESTGWLSVPALASLGAPCSA